MTNYKEKLTAKLKENPEVKENMEKLELWCYIEWQNLNKDMDMILSRHTATKYFTKKWVLCLEKNKWDFKIIWTLKERHLRMYCENRNIHLTINTQWCLNFFSRRIILNDELDFDQQDDLVYKAIVEFLENNKD